MAVRVRLVDRVSTHASRVCSGCRSAGNAPFVRTSVLDGGFGPIHFCSKCARVIGEAVGLGDVEALTAAHAEVLEEYQRTILRLSAELEQAVENRVVRLADVLDLEAERAKRRPETAQTVKPTGSIA